MKLGMWVMSAQPISTAYFIDPFSLSVCLSLHVSPIVTRQRLGKTLPRQRIHVTIEELLDASFLCGLCRIKGKEAISSSQKFLFLSILLRFISGFKGLISLQDSTGGLNSFCGEHFVDAVKRICVVCVQTSFFFNSGLRGYWHCGHSWPIVPASGDSEDDCEEADGM
jgi:hypothetical protein